MVANDDIEKFRKSLSENVKSKNVVPEEPNERVDRRASAESQALADKNYSAIEHNRAKAETDSIVETNRNKKANRRLRWRYAKKVFCYLVAYSIFVGIIIILHGFKVCGFVLPESALSFLVGSTAAAAIGLVYSVTNGLFGNIDK